MLFDIQDLMVALVAATSHGRTSTRLCGALWLLVPLMSTSCSRMSNSPVLRWMPSCTTSTSVVSAWLSMLVNGYKGIVEPGSHGFHVVSQTYF